MKRQFRLALLMSMIVGLSLPAAYANGSRIRIRSVENRSLFELKMNRIHDGENTSVAIIGPKEKKEVDQEWNLPTGNAGSIKSEPYFELVSNDGEPSLTGRFVLSYLNSSVEVIPSYAYRYYTNVPKNEKIVRFVDGNPIVVQSNTNSTVKIDVIVLNPTQIEYRAEVVQLP